MLKSSLTVELQLRQKNRVKADWITECRNAQVPLIEHNRATLQFVLPNEKLNFLVEEGLGCKLIGIELHAESLTETAAYLALKELSRTEAM